MKTRIAAIVMALMMLVASVAMGEAVPAGVTGEFTGTAEGFGGDVAVTFGFENGEMTTVAIEAAGETEGIGTQAMEIMADEIAETGSIAVDTMAGATITSNAILEAAEAAIVAAGLNPDDFKFEANDGPAEDVIRTADVVIVGANAVARIWNAQRWAEKVAANMNTQRMKNLARKIRL